MNTSFERGNDRHDYTKNNESRPIGFNSMAQISGEIEDDNYWEDKKDNK